VHRLRYARPEGHRGASVSGLVIYADVTLRPGVTHDAVEDHCASLNAVSALAHDDPDHMAVTHVLSLSVDGVEHAHLYLAPEATARDAKALRETLDEYAVAVTFHRGEPAIPLDTPAGPIGQTASA
jgi:hypothetical protein